MTGNNRCSHSAATTAYALRALSGGKLAAAEAHTSTRDILR